MDTCIGSDNLRRRNPETSPLMAESDKVSGETDVDPVQQCLNAAQTSAQSLYARCCRYVRSCYTEMIYSLYRRGYDITAYILCEPLETLIRRGIPYLQGSNMPFQKYNMNPDVFSIDNKHNRPMILVHGDANNQGSWTHLGDALNKKRLAPVFTVNLTGFGFVRSDQLLEKIQEIVRRMNPACSTCTIDLVGHSRGVSNIIDVIKRLPQNVRVNDCFFLGCPSLSIEREFHIARSRARVEGNVFEFHGRYDLLEMHTKQISRLAKDENRSDSTERNNVCLWVDSGHVGLLTNKQVIQTIIVRRSQASREGFIAG